MRFKQFINEGAVSIEPQYDSTDWRRSPGVRGEKDEVSGTIVDNAVAFLRKHCKNALWMAEQDQPIYRGDRNIPENDDVVVVDSSATERRSQNTDNFYTVLMDNLPSYSKFPKRSRSFIASTDRYNAQGYSNGQPVRILIPFDGVKIGVCPRNDIWYTRALHKLIDFDAIGYMFKNIGVKNDTWAAFLEFSNEVKTNKKAAEKLLARLADAPEGMEMFYSRMQADFMGFLDEELAPGKLGFKCYTSKTLEAARPKLSNREVWVGGKCVLISGDIWDKIRMAL